MVELLVVIGIIALLIGMLLPALTGARYNAQVVQCESQMRQIVLATLSYCGSNKGQLPPMRNDTGSPSYIATSAPYSWLPGFSTSSTSGSLDYMGAGAGRLFATHYLGNQTLPITTINGVSNTVDWTQAKILYCPSSNPGFPVYYQYNWHMAYHKNPVDGQYYFQPWFKNIRNYGLPPIGAIPSVGYPSSGNSVATAPATTFSYAVRPFSLLNCNVDPSAAIYPVGSTTPNVGALPHDFRGKRAFNFAFSDGHVTSIRMDSRFARAGNTWGRDMDIMTAAEMINQNVGGISAANWVPGTYTQAPFLPY